MGKLNILDLTGHVEVKWDSHSIHVDLNPAEGNANRNERKQVVKMMNEALAKNFKVMVDGEPITEVPDLKGSKTVDFDLQSEDVVRQIVESVVKSKVMSHMLLFKLTTSGRGELIQKSDFQLDEEAEYTAQPVPVGG